MSKKNGILSILCAGRQRHQEFSETAKAIIVYAVESGRSYRDVAEEAGCSPAAVFNIFQRWKKDQTLDRKPRSGRPKKLTVQQIRYVLLSLKRDRRIIRIACQLSRWSSLTNNNTPSYPDPLRSQMEGYAEDTIIARNGSIETIMVSSLEGRY
jgi:DNA-binding Lrp family transcriptional regulator